MKPSITFESGIDTVTGANFIYQSALGKKLMIDCGLIQGEKVAEEKNREPFSFDVSSIEALLVTHAHLDHVGRIPKLVRDGFKGKIYSTAETKALAELVLNDAVSILEKEAIQEGQTPLYGLSDVQAVFPLWQTVNYHEPLQLEQGFSAIFKDAGHILGSSMIEISDSAGGDKIKTLFTGDLGNSPSPLLRDTEAIGEIDYLVMESVYGDRNHEPKEERISKLEKVVNDTVSREGTLVIPAFSVDRTQILLFELNNLVEAKKIPSVPVFVDSPMAIKATQIYKESESLFNDEVKSQIAKGDDIFSFPKLQYTVSANDSRDIEHLKNAKIILAGSGMSMGGRVLRHEAKYLPDEKSTVLLVGYQTAGSLGRQLADGTKKLHMRGEQIKVKAHIETLYGYSAHKDSDHLVEFVSTGSGIKKIFVVMGEPRSAMHLAQRINDESGISAGIPQISRPIILN